MSIIRNTSGNETGAVRQQGRDPDVRERRPADSGSVQAFRQAMEKQGAGQAGAHGASRQDASLQQAQDGRPAFQQATAQDPREPGRGSADILPPAESAAMWQAQHLAAQAPAVTTGAPPPTANPAALAQMLERHVRQLAVSEGGATDSNSQVLLRLDEATLPGTDLMLTRTTDGWLLQADVRSAESFTAIREAAGQLGERFAARGLGNLVVEPRYHA
ncbi:hypothetical protein LY625_03575 [Lysobacter sp. GX 14042]|uniref:hypothetical protein n=1 Tax=Lysobacter sp. GX 14042 TaxID=2907155 RepID=UPI001F38180C|nr:hypothetical protein [Lysobacter sp. GX 14042]MCE7031704.1 hypothetical protein [Lysobacter sp. GX 14042]